MNRPPVVLDRLLVEASSRSRVETGHDLRAGHKRRWIDRDLPLPVFLRLLGAVTAVEEIRFHGWGDPLANPDILAMLAAAAKTGARVVLVTDAGRFDDTHANALVRDGVHAVVFPLAGLSEESNFQRCGTSLFSVMSAIDRLRTVRAVHQSVLPEIAVRYTLTRSGLTRELDALPDFLAGIGATAASVHPLSLAATAAAEQETVVPADQKAYDTLAERLRVAVARAAARGVRLDCRLVHGGQARFRCPDTPGSALFVAGDGMVSPCALGNVPIAGSAAYRFHGRDIPFPRDVRGDLRETAFGAIWRDSGYADFRLAHDIGTPPDGCVRCWRPFLADIR